MVGLDAGRREPGRTDRRAKCGARGHRRRNVLGRPSGTITAQAITHGPSDALRAHIIVVDGQVVGGWKRTPTKTAVVVEVSLLATLSGSEKEAVVAAAQAFGDFLDLPVELRGL